MFFRSLKSTRADNVVLIQLKAIVTLHHYHNHITFESEKINLYSNEKEKQADNKTENNLNKA